MKEHTMSSFILPVVMKYLPTARHIPWNYFKSSFILYYGNNMWWQFSRNVNFLKFDGIYYFIDLLTHSMNKGCDLKLKGMLFVG